MDDDHNIVFRTVSVHRTQGGDPHAVPADTCTNFSCDHQSFCPSNCFERQQYQCRALMNSIRRVYGSETEQSFVVSVDRQQNANSLDTAGKSGSGIAAEVTTPSTGQETNSLDHTDDSSGSCDSSQYGSNGDLSSSEKNDKKHVSMSSLKTPARSAFHEVASHDSLAGLVRSGTSAEAETDSPSWLLHRGELGLPVEPQKTKSGLFARVTKRKESQFGTGPGRRDSTPLLEKLRIRSASRLTNNGPPESDTPGLTGLLSLGMLAGAGAGLLRSSSSNAGLWGALEPSDDEATTETDRSKPGRSPRPSTVPELPIQRYMENQVKNVCSSGFNLLNKAGLLLTSEQMSKVLPLAWELLLEPEEEFISSAACFILFCGVRCPSLVQEMLLGEMQHDAPTQRLNATLRFRALWTHRYHVWSRLDETASTQLRLPPSFIEFVLPSPTLGYPGYEAPDPVWQIRKGTSAEEVQLKQNEATKTFVTASTSRRKQQQELLVRAVAAETIRRREARRKFHLTTCPILERAAVEPSFNKEHRDDGLLEDGTTGTGGATGSGGGGVSGGGSGTLGANTGGATLSEELSATVRRLSVAPMSRGLFGQTRSSSWRQGSIPWFRSSAITHDEDERIFGGSHSLFPSQPLQQAQYIFPSALCAATVPLIHLLDDTSVNDQGAAVNTVAEFVVFQCLLEDTALFLRFILERLTRTRQKDELIFVLRKMIRRLPELPTQSAHAIFNNLVGYMMYHIRTPSPGALKAIGSALSVLYLVVPHVQNIYFKDLKQTMRREQIDSTLLLTANLPCTKQFNVFDNDIGVAQLVRLQDENKDYQFKDILSDVMEASGIPLDQINMYYLCDDRSGVIRNASHYIRDFYTFKRNHTPKLRLRRFGPEESRYLLQENALNLKFQEIGKILFTSAVLGCTPAPQISNHVFFLHEELTKLPSFPRKALESEFDLYDLPDLGHPLLGMDTVHKLAWCQLLSNLFSQMPTTYPWSADLQLFLNVYNGTLILHAEDTSVLRQCLAFFIQCCYQFKTTFSTTGYAGILPTLLRVYNQHMYNNVLTQAIEFTCRQFYVMHRTPFILQLFGSIANYVTVGDEVNESVDEFYQIQPSTLYRLLRMISRPLPDDARILELCNIQTPLKALDFCYEDEEANWSILEAINLCVAVIVYAPDSYRARQMLVILQALFPFILRDLSAICMEESNGNELKKAELLAIQRISITIRQLISTNEFMTRRVEEMRQVAVHAPGGPVEHRTEPYEGGLPPGWANQSVRKLAGRGDEIESNLATTWALSKFDSQRRQRSPLGGSVVHETQAGPSRDNPSSFVGRSGFEPRETILQLSCDFLSTCSARLSDLGEKQRIPELLDAKSHVRLSDLAQAILKHVPSNPDVLTSSALQRYFLEILPLVEWGHESMRSCKALESLLGRLNRTLPKLLEHASARPHLYWDEILKFIRSIYLIIKKNRTIAHLKEIRILLETLKRAILFCRSGHIGSLGKPRLDTHSALVSLSSAAGFPGRPSIGEALFGTISPENSSSGGPGPGRGGSTKRPVPSNNNGASANATSNCNYKHPKADVSDSWSVAAEEEAMDNSVKFTAEVIRLISLVLQVMGPNFCLKDVCERSGPDYNSRCPAILEGGFPTLSIYLSQLIIPLLFRCCSGRKDSPTLSKENVYYALEVCITALFAPDSSSNTRTERPASPTNQQFLEPTKGSSPEKYKDKVDPYGVSMTPSAVDLVMGHGSVRIGGSGIFSTDYENETCSGLVRLISPTLTSVLSKDSGAPASASLVPNSQTNKHLTAKPDNIYSKSRASIVATVTKPLVVPQKARQQTAHSRLLDVAAAYLPMAGDKFKTFRAEFAHRLGFLGLKLILIAYTRHASVRLRLIAATLTKLALNGQNGIHLWKFFDFLATHRPPIFVHLLPFIRFKMANLRCATPGEQAYQQIVSQKLIGLHLPYPQTTAAVLRELMTELNTIQVDMERFNKKQTKDAISNRLSVGHGSVRRLRSTDTSSSIRKASSRRAKKALGSVTKEGPRQDSELSTTEQVKYGRRTFAVASLTSDSICSSDLLDESGVGLPSFTRAARGARSMHLSFRQSFLVRNPRKRISANEGSRLLTQDHGMKQTDPILTASAESLVRGSQQLLTHGKLRNTMPYGSKTKTQTKTAKPDWNKALVSLTDVNGDEESMSSLMSDELRAPVGPAAAAAMATSLYGSGAPYLRAREKARHELASLVGISPPEVETSTDRRDSSTIDFSFSEQSTVHDLPKPKPLEAHLKLLVGKAGVSQDKCIRQLRDIHILETTSTDQNKSENLKSHRRASKMDYV
ncbi:unnamed protein product [Calicophoron daubneyi]|uniref:Uncharacterized protein n=1 Tax=Calicophoron daubneyi TaxID=300641 RepID=A0AAV2TGW4_CALDB